ncbi:hypothetical protein H6P81_015565 [Aristolochia fimbriata]|uniref:SHSP domain-containing protein n=1 Tax=Aristolochia fimbriata TaxID=158543 RepID=A0AAV7E5X8_ARIFI|nr:hypothetical protein H6P81_015565 [Aristolochia fimbriata]
MGESSGLWEREKDMMVAAQQLVQLSSEDNEEEEEEEAGGRHEAVTSAAAAKEEEEEEGGVVVGKRKPVEEALSRRKKSFFGSLEPSAIQAWDPFSEAYVPVTDWKETPQAHVFQVDLPGLNKEDVKVELEHHRVLQISGERKEESQDKNDKWHRIERIQGKFIRRFRLPENAKTEDVKAKMENGVLTVTIPKEEVKEPEVKPIDIA